MRYYDNFMYFMDDYSVPILRTLSAIFKQATSFFMNFQICKKTKKTNGWSVIHNEDAEVETYAYKNDQWVSYDDVDNIRAKANYIRKMNLGGGLMRTLDLDDFRGICGCGKYPLLTAMNEVLRPNGTERSKNCT